MPARPEFEIELDAIFLEEARSVYGDVENAIRNAIPWILTRIVACRDFTELARSFMELRPAERRFRQHIPTRPQPVDRQADSEYGGRLAVSDEREQEGEGHEGQNRRKATQHNSRCEAGEDQHAEEHGRVNGERDHPLTGRDRHGDDEAEQPEEFGLGCEPVNRARAMDMQMLVSECC